jgi:hypothetical protein
MTPLDLKPSARHSKGFGGTWDAMIAIGCLPAGIYLTGTGHLWGLILIVASPVIARDAYLKYKAGNWP